MPPHFSPKSSTSQRGPLVSYEEALADLERRGIMPLRAPTLENTKLALERFCLQYPKDLRRVILIAGTNGKGSTAKTLETLLLSCGRSVGLYTSPHLESYCERIALGGEAISETLFELAWRKVRDATVDLPLSHFEMLTVMAAWVFFSGQAQTPVDDAVFEVGLGGLWDATNAIPHGTSVICRLGFDHQEILGSTLEEISANKFGIVTAETQVVVHLPLPPEAETIKKKVQAQLHFQAQAGAESPSNVRWFESTPWQMAVDRKRHLPLFYLESQWGRAQIALPGARGAENTNLALNVFAALGHDPAPSLQVLQQVNWPARMQKLDVPGTSCPVFLSGDHNEQGIDSLIDLLRYYDRDHLRLVIGVGVKKNLDQMLARLTGLERARFWLTRADFQGRTRSQYGAWLDRAEGFFEEPLDALMAACKDAAPTDLVLITGSLYLSGDLLRALHGLSRAKIQSSEPSEEQASLDRHLELLAIDFVADIPTQLKNWVRLIHDFSFEELMRSVHSLKGSSQAFGFVEFAQALHLFEDWLISDFLPHGAGNLEQVSLAIKQVESLQVPLSSVRKSPL
jgi:dihydrofolate synthase/folylpolyglutamate synthase